MARRHAPQSLRTRLLAGLLGATLLTWALAFFLSYRDALHELNEVLDGYLAQSAALLIVQLGHEVEEIDTEHVPLLHRYGRKVAFQVWEGGRVLRLHSHSAPDVRLSPVTEGFSDSEVEGERWRVFSAFSEDRTFLVQVAERASVRDEIAHKVATGLLRPVLFALPVLVLVIWLGVKRGLAPLATLRREVETRRAGDLAPLATSAPAEVAPLVAALNALFERLRLLLEHERRFTADAAHELRTPLAAIRTQAQVALAAGAGPERERALRQVLAGCDRATRLVEQLLTLARLEGGTQLRRQTCGLRAVAEQVLAEMAPEAVARGVNVVLAEGAEIEVAGDCELLAVLVRNLIDNAVRYGGAGGQVTVAVKGEARGPLLAVSDEGPGIPPEQRPLVWQRFHRVLGSGESGSGLGLSIVRRIAELHGATAELDTGPGGRGLTVRVRFPGTPS